MSQLAAGVWTKSSRCDAGQCVEARWQDGRLAVRASTAPDARLEFDRASWHGLLTELRAGGLGR